jgi:hypothetical protein
MTHGSRARGGSWAVSETWQKRIRAASVTLDDDPQLVVANETKRCSVGTRTKTLEPDGSIAIRAQAEVPWRPPLEIAVDEQFS